MSGLQPLDYLPAFAFLALVFALGELFVAQLQARHIALFSILLGFSLILVRAWLILTKRMHLVAPLFETTLPVLWFLGPLIRAFLLDRVLGQTIRFGRLALHFIPAAVAVLLLIPSWLQPTSVKLQRIESLYAGQPEGVGAYLFLAGLLHNIFYMLWTLKDLYSEISLDSLKKESVVRASLLFPALIVMGTFVAVIALLTKNYDWLAISITIVAFNAPTIYIVQRRYPQFFYDLEQVVQRDKERNRYQRSRLGGISLDELEIRLKRIMEEQEAYKDEDLSLPELASRLDITAHQLSEYINHHLRQNFAGLVNQYRVKAACDLLLSQRERTVLSIAYDVGFNSKSTFNDAFQRHTGLSPGQFRKQQGSRTD
ncbi:MAG: hypothetical protein CMN76_13720 [Spirochaetaceae bacterium]|nr:hypothetical protein [Spirochaetaceae bacterium]|tara:strand:- start:292754 stop:293863 length:1110 start_codon:yes stop_codon:yes gene_type:complete